MAQGFFEGLLLAEQIAQKVADEWQVADHPDWHGGVEAAKQIVELLRKERGTKKLSAFQQHVIDLLSKPDAQLSNSYEGEGAPYRPSDGMYSGVLYPNIHTPRHSLTVPYRTIAALMRAGALEESHRVNSTAMQGDSLVWEHSMIYYCVKSSKKEGEETHVNDTAHKPLGR